MVNASFSDDLTQVIIQFPYNISLNKKADQYASLCDYIFSPATVS